MNAELPPLFDFVTPMPYTALQQLMDEANGWGVHCYQKSLYLEAITDDVIAVISEQLPGKSSPLSVLAFYRLDEAYSETSDMDTAFSGGRSPRWSTYVIAFCPTPELLVADRAWVRRFFEALRPLGLDDGADANHLNLDDQDRIRAAYGDAKLRRLAEIKGQYDPGNIFHRNINIKPL